MIEITREQCTRMLVWDDNENLAQEVLVCAKVEWASHPYRTLYNGEWKNAKPLPEPKLKPKPKQMTALDAMWCAGIRKVYRTIGEECFWCVTALHAEEPLAEREWNELIRKDGETTLRYDEWKEFTFENCEMGE